MFLRVARRPAVRPQIANVKEFIRANGAAGITKIAFAHVGVPFAFEKYHLAFFLRLSPKQRNDRAASHGRLGFHTGEFEKRRPKIREVNKSAAGSSLHARAPNN